MGLTYGPRFGAFLPLGNKARLEYSIFLITRRLNGISYQDIMNMPSSRRERFVKSIEAIELEERRASEQQAKNRPRVSRGARRRR